jgi:hypothetical protein
MTARLDEANNPAIDCGEPAPAMAGHRLERIKQLADNFTRATGHVELKSVTNDEEASSRRSSFGHSPFLRASSFGFRHSSRPCEEDS